MALIFIPVLGGIFGGRQGTDTTRLEALRAAEDGDLSCIGGLAGVYLRRLERLLRHPAKTFGVALLCLFGAYAAYIGFGRGVEFFPGVEPDFTQVQVQARGDLSVHERDALVRKVERRLLGLPELKTVYARTLGSAGQARSNVPEDVIGIIQLEFIHWQERRPAAEIIPELRARTADIPGLLIQIREQESGPSAGKPVQIEISARDPTQLEPAVERLGALLSEIGGFVDMEDSRPLPSIEWRVSVDREQAARYGADIALLGDTIKLVTTGIKHADYRPDDADEELDMLAILVTQFNSFYQAGLVLSAIVFLTAGVLLGLLVTNQPFGIVMGGIGVIALAGIVVNNNIILIDTYNDLKRRGLAPPEAILRTAAQRMRPVLLTSITTVLGLLPMVFAVNIDLIGQDIAIGAPSTQWWTQLSSAIAGGLTFATVLTLVLTPCLLMLGENISAWRARRRTARTATAEPLGRQPGSNRY